MAGYYAGHHRHAGSRRLTLEGSRRGGARPSDCYRQRRPCDCTGKARQ
jgi:hypothetical protein